MRNLLLAIIISLLLFACGSKPEQKILGKWESSGVFKAEFTPTTASWMGGGCKHSGYRSEVKQVDGKKVTVISFTCEEFILDDGKPSNLTLSVVPVDDKIVFLNQVYFRINN